MEKQSVKLVRAAIDDIKDEFMPGLLSWGGYETIRKSLEETKEICLDENLSPYTITSSCKMGLDEIDRLWMGKIYDKIVGWITLDDSEMFVLECDPAFLTLLP
ncbi:hypothetical protein LguiB_005494 [Lonicera macranthoides]